MTENAGLIDKLESLRQLNRGRFDYVIARAHKRSISAALDEIGVSPKWYYSFSEEERKQLEDLADDLHKQKKIQAELILAEALPEAAQVKADGLRSEDERIRQDSASEILDRNLGKAKQVSENKTEVAGELTIVIKRHKSDRIT